MGKNTYEGDNNVDIVKQNQNHDWYNIITKGGDDQITVTLTQTWVNAGEDDDWVKSTVEGANRIALGAGNDTYIGNGFAKSGRHDEVYGGAGNDTMTIFTRHSDYHGDGGKDFISSAGYWNNIIGGNGNDTISYQAQDSDSYLKGWGVDLDLGSGIARTGEGRKEHIYDFENAEGTSYGDGMVGSAGNNKLWGMDGSDEIWGMKGDDKLFGGVGTDWLYGGNGADELTGGKGTDHLEGGGGKDVFIFASASELGKGNKADVILDFETGDKIDLSGVGGLTFVGKADFTGTAGELRFENGLLQADTDGNGKADFEIKVEDVKTLHDTDFNL